MPWRLKFAIDVVLASAGALFLYRGYVVTWFIVALVAVIFSIRYGPDWRARLRQSWLTRSSAAGRIVSILLLLGAMVYVSQVGVERAIANPYFILAYWIWMVWSAWRFSRPAPSASASA